MTISAIGRNLLWFRDFCDDGGGPNARVTSDSAFTIGRYECRIPIDSSCSAFWTIGEGSGTLSGSALNLCMQGVLVGCGYNSDAMSVSFLGTLNGSPGISSLEPPSQTVASPSFVLTVSGVDFSPSSVVNWNGSPRITRYLDGSTLTADIPSADVASVGTASVTVDDPVSGSSAPMNFDVTAPSAVVISSLNPASLPSEGDAFTLALGGSGFTESSIVNWNGSPRATTFHSQWALDAAILSSDLACAGLASVTVTDPSFGGASNPATFLVTPGQAAALLPLGASDMVWDANGQQLLLSIPDTGSSNPNTITVLDPVSGTVRGAQFAGSQPNRLALSGDGQYLYVGLDGSAMVRRFTLPDLVKDIDISLGTSQYYGPLSAWDLAAAPGAPGTIAVSLGTAGVSPAAVGGMVIYDDGIPRPTSAPGLGAGVYDSIQWGADVTVMYAADNEITDDFYTLSVTADGVSLNHTYPNLFRGLTSRIHFDPVTGLIYGEDGLAIAPATGMEAGTYAGIFGTRSAMLVDSANNAAFFVTYDIPSSATTVTSFDLEHFTPTASVTVTTLAGAMVTPLRVARFGATGLAFLTSDGQVALMQVPGSTPASCP